MTRWNPALGDEVFQLLVDIFHQVFLQHIRIDRTRAQDSGSVLVVEEAEKQMFECRIFMMAFIGHRESPVERLFEIT